MSVMAVPSKRVASRPGRGGTPDGRRREGSDAGAGNSLAVEHVRREQDGGHLSVIDPIMAEAVGLAADVAGLVLDRSGAGGAIFGDRAAQRVDECRAILMTVQRDDAAGLNDEPARTQL